MVSLSYSFQKLVREFEFSNDVLRVEYPTGLSLFHQLWLELLQLSAVIVASKALIAGSSKFRNGEQ